MTMKMYTYYDGKPRGPGRPRSGWFLENIKLDQKQSLTLSMLKDGNPKHHDTIEHDFGQGDDRGEVLSDKSPAEAIRKASMNALLRIMQGADKDQSVISAVKEILDRLDAQEKKNGKTENVHDINEILKILTIEQLDQIEASAKNREKSRG